MLCSGTRHRGKETTICDGTSCIQTLILLDMRTYVHNMPRHVMLHPVCRNTSTCARRTCSHVMGPPSPLVRLKMIQVSLRNGPGMCNPVAACADITSYLAGFVHDKQHLYFASVSRGWRNAWGQERPKVTAAVTADTSVSELLFSIECGAGRTGKRCTAMAELRRLDLLQCARSNGFPWGRFTCAKAAEGGHLDVLAWMRSNGCPWDKWTCSGAAGGGHLDVLRWVRSNSCPWDKNTCSSAGRGGHFDVLQWARSNRCPWDEDTCAGAAHKWFLNVLE